MSVSSARLTPKKGKQTMETATENHPFLTLIQGGNDKKTESVIVVGWADIDAKKLAQNGLLVHEQWKKLPANRPCIPLHVDRILLLSDAVDVLLAKTAQDIAEKEALPITFTHSSLETLSQDLLSKTREPKEEEVAVETLTNAVKRNAMNTHTEDGRTTGANVQAKEAKLDFVRELFRKDRLMPTKDVLRKVEKKFGRGITPQLVIDLRQAEFGVKFGPRGTIKEGAKNEAQVVESTEIDTPRLRTGDKSATQRLTELMGELRNEMKAQGILYAKIPTSGTAQIVYEAVSEVSLPAVH